MAKTLGITEFLEEGTYSVMAVKGLKLSEEGRVPGGHATKISKEELEKILGS